MTDAHGQTGYQPIYSIGYSIIWSKIFRIWLYWYEIHSPYFCACGALIGVYIRALAYSFQTWDISKHQVPVPHPA